LWDLWMVVHFLSGVSGGLSNVFLELSSPVLMLSGLSLMVAWEIGEFAGGVRERMENRFMDLVVGSLGVYAGASWSSAVPTSLAKVSFFTTVLVTLMGCFIGWRAYRKREGRKATASARGETRNIQARRASWPGERRLGATEGVETVRRRMCARRRRVIRSAEPRVSVRDSE